MSMALHLMCSEKYSYHPTEGTSALDPPSPSRISIPGGACHTPYPLEFSIIFQLGWVPSGKNNCVKNVLALCYYVKDNFFCDKMRKSLFIYVNMVSNDLKNVLS